jgi:hypothetical protein
MSSINSPWRNENENDIEMLLHTIRAAKIKKKAMINVARM